MDRAGINQHTRQGEAWKRPCFSTWGCLAVLTVVCGGWTQLLWAQTPSATRVSKERLEEEMVVVQHRSHLMVAGSDISRTVIADSSVIEVVRYSPNEIAIVGLDLGVTTLTLWLENNPDPLTSLVRVVRDPRSEAPEPIDSRKLEQRLGLLFPDSKVYLVPLSSKIVVKGRAHDALEAAQILSVVRGEIVHPEGIVNMLEVPSELRLMLRVQIAEVNRSQLRRLGVDFESLINDRPQVPATGDGELPATPVGIFENGEIRFLMNWLNSSGAAKILTDQTLRVTSGHPAGFLSGGEFAVATFAGLGGTQPTTTTFRGFGTSLIVTPTVIAGARFRMRIVPVFSQWNRDTVVAGVPASDARRFQRTVELQQGQTIAIAGLPARPAPNAGPRIPFLGEIPVAERKGVPLRRASRRPSLRKASQDEAELLILITPESAQPQGADDVQAMPGSFVLGTFEDVQERKSFADNPLRIATGSGQSRLDMNK